jgi:hypothetical protein
VRKINELVKRARMSRVHALIVGHLKGQMPFFGQQSKQKALLDNLADEFFAVMKKHRLPQGDFPNLARFKEVAMTYDFGKFKKLDEKFLESADAALTGGIPTLLKQLGEEQDARAAVEKERHAAFLDSGVANPTVGPQGSYMGGGGGGHQQQQQQQQQHEGGGMAGGSGSEGGAGATAAGNPFGGGAGGGSGSSPVYAAWAAFIGKPDSDSIFRLLPGGQEGLVSGAGAKDVLLESGLDVGVLRGIWDLADIDRDGFLDRDEFAVAMYLMQQVKAGKPLPLALAPNTVPPNKR